MHCGKASNVQKFFRVFYILLFLEGFVNCWVNKMMPPLKISSLSARTRMSFFASGNEYTSESLVEYAKKMVEGNLELEPESRSSVCIVVAGGGGHAISTLSATSGASSMLLEGTVAYDRRAFRSYIGMLSDKRKVRYNSMEAAKLASETALKRAMTFKTNHLNKMNGCIGVGCSSAVVSSSSPDSFNGSGFIVATRADGSQLSVNVTLASKASGSTRTRIDEDIFISHIVLRSIELIHQWDSVGGKDEETRTSEGDIISESWGTVLPQNEPDVDTAFSAAQRLLDGDETALVLLPVYKEGRPVDFKALRYPVIPDGSLVMPGSFNPPHKGHISLGKAALRAADRMGFSTRHEEIPIFMELSLTNADKPPIDPQTASERIRKFLQLEELPKHWGVVLTRAPLFSQKLSCLQNCVMESSEGQHGKIFFVIGADTLKRILNPKYYSDDKDQMINALLSMKGAHFIAGGRVEQKNESSEPARFITGKEELGELPSELKEKFIIIEEKEFRIDISSTEIRQKQAEQASKVAGKAK